MAKGLNNSSIRESTLAPKRADQITTQRAYTLRLRGIDPQDNSWRDALWATHDAINRGTKVFGDWLLTLRGGLSHELAEPPPPAKGKKRTDEEAAAIRKNRRILLALSWLSVEDDRGAPNYLVRVANGTEADAARREKVVTALRDILTSRGVGKQEIDSWVADCADSLSSRIREDAAWINRSAAFDTAEDEIGSSLTRDEVWDILEPFFASRESYFAQIELADDDSGAEEKAKDLVQKAGQWLSSRFGTGAGTDFESMAKVYAEMKGWAEGAKPFRSGADALADMAKSLAQYQPASTDADGILALISGPGYKSATRNIVKAWGDRATAVSRDDLAKFAEVTARDQAKSEARVGRKGRRLWSDKILEKVESACGFTYLQKGGPARHSEFAVMLDHAARRVSIGHSWIKRAEAQRRNFEEDAKRLDNVPNDAAEWLDAFVAERSGTSGAAAAGGEYRIRRRAIEGWDEVVKKWRRASCKTEQDRIAAAREVQADPDIDKFGDIQLFEALAADDAVCVWQQNEKATPDPLRDYVLGHDARFKQRRFKVPAYRHPDPLRHPVFCDFGNSRWDIEYAVHEAAKANRAKRTPDESRAAWMKDRCGLRMGLWNRASLQDVALRWSSKRLSRDLALGPQKPDKPVHVVGRADRLGRAASGMKPDKRPIAAGLFEIADWNGRLQAPRAQLDAIAACIDGNAGKWDDKARKLRDRIEWLVTFSAKLECQGPFMEYAAQFGDDAPAKPFVSRKGELAVKHTTNDNRQGHAKLILSRLPGLRVLSVDLGHRYAASCAVWETLSLSALKKETAGRVVAGGGDAKQHLFLHTRHTDARGKERTTIYRRIGSDRLSDGSEHPAPWARLDRQFLIKLQGEEAPARKASPEEINAVRGMETELGRLRDERNPLPMRVDELMAEAARTVRLALRRLGDSARIAYAFKPDAARLLPGGGAAEHTPETRKDAMLDALMRWHDLATGDRWTDPVAKTTWTQHIVPRLSAELPTLSEEADRWERKRHRAALKVALDPVAAALVNDGAARLHTLWFDRWKTDNSAWRPRLKWLRRWVLPRGLRPVPGESAQQGAKRKVRRGAARHVGGLSLTRIATIRELYQAQKAYAMRPEPDDLRKNIAAKDDDRFDEFGRSVLKVVERLREQRVKQLASRIAEAALGIGRMSRVPDRDRRRPTEQVDEPCHAVVIENLRNYRPDELQTRRENRALMNWSAGKVRKYLGEACQLHGLHLREVMPNYTSRQCSRTGLPGVRCADVPVWDFLTKPWWRKRVKDAKDRESKPTHDKPFDAEARMFVELDKIWPDPKQQPENEREAYKKRAKAAKPLRLIVKGGDLFVAAPPNGIAKSSGAATVRERSVCALQADLNAAANIGLRALLDPDFLGKWWYVPCDSATGQPAKDKCAGAACLRLDEVLLNPAKPDGDSKPNKKTKGGDKTNAWRDVGASDEWRVHADYWNNVKARVADSLRTIHGLESARSDSVDAAEPPW
ncbi:MAG: hypothetical protein BroJett003_25250 [Planctomycetota bacterium]|nr:MAG: hypothetical protein BroJett003_25250 [Planctomycetota bacterium]